MLSLTVQVYLQHILSFVLQSMAFTIQCALVTDNDQMSECMKNMSDLNIFLSYMVTMCWQVYHFQNNFLLHIVEYRVPTQY